MTVRVERFAGEPAEWDAFVRTQPGWTHFHLAGWRGVVESVFRHPCTYLVARDDAGAIVGALPLVSVRSVLFGSFLVSMPFVNYGGPLGAEPAVEALVREAMGVADEQRIGLLELRSRRPLALELPVSHRKLTVVLDLPAGDPERLWASFEPKLRTKIRRSQKEGVTVRFGADEAAGFYRVFSHHMRDLGTPTQPRKFFDALATAFPDDVWFGCAYLGGEPIAGGCGFRWGTEFEMTWSSALRSHSKIRPNMLLFWSFIERAAAQGLSLFNFGRSSPGSGTHEFKKQWNGARDEPLWWYQYSRSGPAKTPSPDDSAYSWGPRIWKRIPVPVATALGPRLARWLP